MSSIPVNPATNPRLEPHGLDSHTLASQSHIPSRHSSVREGNFSRVSGDGVPGARGIGSTQ